MLVLTRKEEEKIIIGSEDEIIITILNVQKGKVSIGIEADPLKYKVFRHELLYKTQKRSTEGSEENNFEEQEVLTSATS